MKRSFDDLNTDEATDEKAPIKFQDLQPGEAKELFRVLMNGETSRTQSDMERIAAALEAVGKFPELANVVDEESNSSLLEHCWFSYATLELGLGLSPYAVDALKTLIKANPYALVWFANYPWGLLTSIADDDGPGSEFGDELFLWIFEHYSWVFDQECYLLKYEGNRPLYHLMNLHLRDEVPTSALKDFFNKYPHMLMSRSGRYANPLVQLLANASKSDRLHNMEFIEFMLHKCPQLSSVIIGQGGASTFYRICEVAVEDVVTGRYPQKPDNVKVCKLMFQLNPSAATVTALEGELPIELLARTFVKGSPLFDVMADIARLMYPKLTKHLTATRIDLIREILKVLDKEKEVALMSIRLKRAKLLLSSGSSRRKESSSYCCWVKNRLLELQARTKEYEKDIAALKQWDGSVLDS